MVIIMMQEKMTAEQTMQPSQGMAAQQPDQKQIRAHFSKLGAMMFCGTLIIMVLQVICQGIAGAVNPNIADNYNLLFAAQMLPMYLIGYPLMFLLVKQVKPSAIAQHDITGSQLFAAFTITYALMILGNLLGLGVTGIIGLLKGDGVVNPLLNIVSSGNIWINAIYTVLLAPVFEEFLFRKLVVDRTVRYGEGVAVAVSGLMFGLFHGNLNQFVYALPMGLFFAFLYVKTGKIRYTVILHMAVNFMGTVLGPLCTAGLAEGSAAKLAASAVFSILVYAFVVTGIVFMVKSRKSFRLTAGEVALEKGRRFRSVIVNLGMILYCGFWMLNIVIMLFV